MQNPCIFPTLPFDFEPVNGDATFDLDLVWGRSYESATVVHNANQRYNNGTGDYPNDNGSFFSATSFCSSNETVLDMLFGKLRPSNTRRDLAILRTNEIRIYHNTGSGMATNANQVISQSGSGSWGPFVAGDNYEDLVVSDGSQIRAYRNLTNGNLDLTPYTFPITATKILVAQMDEDIYKRDFNTRFDLVSYSGSTVSVRMNNNDNTLGSPQSHTVGFTISSIAVGDFDNNNFNDVIIGGSSTVKIFPNTNGTINWTSPLWTVSVSLSSPIVLVGDMGTPTDPNRIDGWVDVVVSGYEAPVKIFANTQGAFSSTPQQSFQSGLPYSGVGKMTLADIQNTGGLSFVYTHSSTPIGQPTTMMIRTNKHTGNPAPAPPKGVAVAATPPDPYGYRYPKVTWAPNGERDINGYDVWRRIVSATDCGNGVWYYLASVNGSTWEYTDGSIGTAGLGNQCTAEYKVLAKDAANNLSDFSAVVQIQYSNLWFKRSEEGGGKLVARVPSRHELHAAYPNPFNPSTEIKFDLPEDAHVTLAVYDMLGRKVADLVSDNYAAGYHSATWNANEIASGVYFARFTASDVNGTLKLSKSSKLILNK